MSSVCDSVTHYISLLVLRISLTAVVVILFVYAESVSIEIVVFNVLVKTSFFNTSRFQTEFQTIAKDSIFLPE
jgi:hypothetical protein